MVNGANIDTEENRSKSAAYENGEEISFANNQEVLDWGGYYARQYRFANEDAPGFKRATGPQTRQTKWKVQWENVAERENACKQKVLDTYGTVDGCTRLAKVMQAVHKLDDGTVYDETYVYADLNTAIERKKMVCWHFFRIIRTILRESGVDVECMVVQRYADGAYHSMLRWKDENNAWHYTDPTMYVETKSDLYCDMPYSLFQNTYHPAEGTCLDQIQSVAY